VGKKEVCKKQPFPGGGAKRRETMGERRDISAVPVGKGEADKREKKSNCEAKVMCKPTQSIAIKKKRKWRMSK